MATSMKAVYEELKRIEKNMVTKQDLRDALDSIDIAGNEDTMRQIRESEEDVKKGRTKRISSVKDLLIENG